jgi:SAM-dependent methyltransferase
VLRGGRREQNFQQVRLRKAILKYVGKYSTIFRRRNFMSHWTEDLFVNHPELFVKALEERVLIAGDEVDLFLEYLRDEGFKPRRILDLNCGIGRHSIELGKRGISVLGTDLSPYYIQIAKKRAECQEVTDKVSFRVADMRRIGTVLTREKFDGIINLFTSFGFYDDKTNADILRQCCSLVRPEGFFALEIMNRDWLLKNFQQCGFSRYENLIVLEDRAFDAKTSRTATTWTYLVQKNGKKFALEKQVTIDTRLWSLHELIDIFERAGWRFKAVYPGLRRQQRGVSPIELQRLFFIAIKPSHSKKPVA